MESIGNPISTQMRFGGVTTSIAPIETSVMNNSSDNTKRNVLIAVGAFILLLAALKYIKSQYEEMAEKDLKDRR